MPHSKSLLAHTAVDIENPGPDYKTGYGSIRVVPAVAVLRDDNFVEDQLDQDETFSAVVIVGPGDSELKVTIAWDDEPATPNVQQALVNDLDLRVFDPQSISHYPWTLDANQPTAPAVRNQPDHTNNLEQVFIDDPTPGTYRIEVRGYNIPAGPQSFSLVATPLLVACSSAGSGLAGRTALSVPG